MSLNDDAKNAVMTYNNKKAVEVAKKAVAENADIVELIDTVLQAPEDEAVIASVRAKVNEMMKDYPMFAW